MDLERRIDGAASIDRALRLLKAVAGNGDLPLREHARQLALPVSTAYRLIEVLRRHGLVAPSRRGHYVAGLGLAQLAAPADRLNTVVACARPLIRQLARKSRATVHLGIFEDDMITYLIKEQGGTRTLFSREGGQLEAYCSAIGRVLLAHLAEPERERYLAAGPFFSLTPQTVTDTDAMRSLLHDVRARGYAIDDREIADDLFCIAVPIIAPDGSVTTAVSISMSHQDRICQVPPAALLRCASQISARLYG